MADMKISASVFLDLLAV